MDHKGGKSFRNDKELCLRGYPIETLEDLKLNSGRLQRPI